MLEATFFGYITYIDKEGKKQRKEYDKKQKYSEDLLDFHNKKEVQITSYGSSYSAKSVTTKNLEGKERKSLAHSEGEEAGEKKENNTQGDGFLDIFVDSIDKFKEKYLKGNNKESVEDETSKDIQKMQKEYRKFAKRGILLQELFEALSPEDQKNKFGDTIKEMIDIEDAKATSMLLKQKELRERR